MLETVPSHPIFCNREMLNSFKLLVIVVQKIGVFDLGGRYLDPWLAVWKIAVLIFYYSYL